MALLGAAEAVAGVVQDAVCYGGTAALQQRQRSPAQGTRLNPAQTCTTATPYTVN